MRRQFALATILFPVLLLPSAPATVRPQPTMHALPSNPVDAKKELQKRYLAAKREQASRRFLAGVRRHIPDPDLGFLERKYHIAKDPVFQDMTDEHLDLVIHNLETEITTRELTYGPDDVKDVIYHPAEDTGISDLVLFDEEALNASRSVVAIVDRHVLTRDSGGTWTLDVKALTSVLSGGENLCTFDRFHGAPFTTVNGTGFLVAEDLIVTAGHVVYDPHDDFLKSVYFLFDYALESEGTAKVTYTDDQVYEGLEVVEDRNESDADWAVVRLDRATGREPLACRTSGKIPSDAKLYMLGYPYGMPIKYAGEAGILENTPCTQFLADLDTYPDNSGSPVFNAEDNVVEGILVSDIGNFQQYCNCLATGVYADWMGFPGATVTRITEVTRFLALPEAFMIRCRVPVARVVVAFQEAYLEENEEREFPFDGLGVDLQVDDQCVIRYDCQPGDQWEIVEGANEGPIIMEPACPE